MEPLARARAAISANPLVVDTAIALLLAALSLLTYVSGAAGVGLSSAVVVTLLLLESLPLIVRRRYPLAVMAVVSGATIVHLVIIPANQPLQVGLGILVATYTIGERLDRRTSLTVTTVLCAAIAVIFIGRAGIGAVLGSLIQTELIFIVAWLLGDAARIRRLYAGTLEERAQRLERERDERAERAVRDERERIARELHDVVTHHVSVIVIQAGGALRVIDKRPEEARTALEAISSTGRLALVDMRRMLGILGEQEASDPTPGLDRLGELVEQLRSAGLDVELVIDGEPRTLDPGLAVSAYRIIQEALTNSLKHTGGGRARVVVRYATDALEITVDDERGPDAPSVVEPPHEGRGLIGMRERAAMLRGTLVAHPTANGFLVDARLPIDDAVPLGMSIRVLLVDDQQLVRTGFRMILTDEEGIEVVGEAANGRDAVDAAPRLRPDVVVMDIRMPVMDGVEATRRLSATGPDAPRVLVLTTFDTDEHVVEALRAGASGFLLKDVTPADFVAAIRIVASGEALIAPSVTRRLLERFVQLDTVERRRTGPPDRPAHGTGARGAHARRPGPVQPRDRRAPRPRRADGEDPRLAPAAQARPARSGAARRARLRVGDREPGSGATLGRQDREPLPPGGGGEPIVKGYERHRREIAVRCDDRRPELEGVACAEWMDSEDALGEQADPVGRGDLTPAARKSPQAVEPDRELTRLADPFAIEPGEC